MHCTIAGTHYCHIADALFGVESNPNVHTYYYGVPTQAYFTW